MKLRTSFPHSSFSVCVREWAWREVTGAQSQRQQAGLVPSTLHPGSLETS